MPASTPGRRPPLPRAIRHIKAAIAAECCGREERSAIAAGVPRRQVEPGETPDAALVREIAEELGCAIAVDGWLAGEAAIGSTHVLTVARGTLLSGEPHPHEHDAIRWLATDELDDVDWLEPDRPFLDEVRSLLG